MLVKDAAARLYESSTVSLKNSNNCIAKEASERLVGPAITECAPLHVLVVDDDQQMRTACCHVLAQKGAHVSEAGTLAEGEMLLQNQKVDLLLLDLKLPDGGGLALLEKAKVLYPDTAVVVMTAYATVSSAVEAMRIGARDYLTKPFALEELTAVLKSAGQRVHFDRESRLLREKLRSQTNTDGLVGRSSEMQKLYRILSKVAFSTHPVLILGESGTGKEVVARSIHFNGPNVAKPFVQVDCSSPFPIWIESELFGHVRGAFPGADCAKEGLLASVSGGTVFLDEIGALPLDLQSRLLRALQEKEVRPMGGTQARPISARVLAATNRNLAAMVEQGKFRKDLFFRLNVVNLKMPALRERRDDIPLLVVHFMAKAEKEAGVERTVSDEALRALVKYDWPGNVRELENAIERAWVLSNGLTLNLDDLPISLQDLEVPLREELTIEPAVETIAQPDYKSSSSNSGHIVPIAEMEKQAILGTIRMLNGDKILAAKLLGIGKTTLYRKLKEYGVSDEFEGPILSVS
ncbi:sigma-54-dependent transcriptional regulator [Edaphobacter modestus]|uniref:Two-component system response regulator HydG n=1 Tax=Edaphobacter modestus TaxID=388466 RepID=A0A4Q7YUV7_9BACT|nr:sigma-54 dependent transcriptional regulator [Edaphobacter modestus]RZU40775.1 two-component system response regulator HydG [Edaphobacter modestus]